MSEGEPGTPDPRPPLPHDPPPPPGYVDPLDDESPLSDLTRFIDPSGAGSTEGDA